MATPILPMNLRELADPSALHSPIDVSSVSAGLALEFLRRMTLVRVAEEVIGDLVEAGEAVCPCHLAVGQEACAVGVTAALDGSIDKVFGAHRSHGHYLGLGGDVFGLLAEILGRIDGCSKGMGGSMHLTAPDRGLVGTVPIVGATVPMAAGAALSARLLGSPGVAVSFFGDGAVEEGVVQEAMNLAAVHELPVLFVCENNLFSSHLHIDLRQRGSRQARYAEAHGIDAVTLDGNDVIATYHATVRAVQRARAGDGPSFLELVTYRWRGHVGYREDVDVGVRRSGDLPLWKGRDPLRRMCRGLENSGVSNSELHGVLLDTRKSVAAALDRARAADYPPLDAAGAYLYSDQRATASP